MKTAMRIFFSLLIGWLVGRHARDNQLTYEVLSMVNITNALELKVAACDPKYKPSHWAVDGIHAYVVKP